MQAEDADITKGHGARENLPLDFLIAFTLFVISLFLRLPHYTEVYTYPDELYYMSYAYSILSNGWSWPVEFMLAQPPLFPYMGALLTYLFGGGLEVFRIISIIFGCMSVLVMYFFGKELFDRRVGILSAVLLCFCSYHILYSRIAMLEAVLIFFILASIYYFFKSYNKEDDIKYACLCGIFCGLACETKWTGLLLYPVFFLFILWTKRNIHALFEKKFLLTALTSVLIQLPVWIDLHLHHVNPIYWQLFASSNIAKGTTSLKSKSYGVVELLTRGFNNYIDLVTDGSSPATLSLVWHPIFYIAASSLLVIAILYYFCFVLKAKPRESLIFIYFVTFSIFFAYFAKRNQYYLLTTLPAFLIMLSGMCFRFVDQIKSMYRKKKHKFFPVDFARVFILVFIGLFVFSYISVGTMAPLINRGAFSGHEEQILKIVENIEPGDAIAVDWYYIDVYKFNPEENPVFPLYYRAWVTPTKQAVMLDIELLRTVKPRFIIVTLFFYNSPYTSTPAKILIRDEYNLISIKYAGVGSLSTYDILLFERKQDSKTQNSYEIQNESLYWNASGIIYSDVFYRTLPEYMTVGKPYNILTFVENSEEVTDTFFVTLEVPKEFIYSSSKNWRIITLDKGESRRIEFTILPIKQHVGELNVTATISLIESRHVLPSTFRETDNASASVLWIKKIFSTEDIVTFIYVIVIITFMVTLITIKYRKIFK